MNVFLGLFKAVFSLFKPIVGLCTHAPDTTGPTYHYRLYDEPTDTFNDNTETTGLLANSELEYVIDWKTDKKINDLDVTLQTGVRERDFKRFVDNVTGDLVVMGGFHRYNIKYKNSSVYYQDRLIAPDGWFSTYDMGMTVLEKTDGLHTFKITIALGGTAGELSMSSKSVKFDPTLTDSEIAVLPTATEGNCIINYTTQDNRTGTIAATQPVYLWDQIFYFNKSGTKATGIFKTLLLPYNNNGQTYQDRFYEYFVVELDISVVSDNVVISGNIVSQGTDFPYGLSVLPTSYGNSNITNYTGSNSDITPVGDGKTEQNECTTTITLTQNSYTYASYMPIACDYNGDTLNILSVDLEVYVGARSTQKTSNADYYFYHAGLNDGSIKRNSSISETLNALQTGYKGTIKLNGQKILEEIKGDFNAPAGFNNSSSTFESSIDKTTGVVTIITDTQSASSSSLYKETSTFISFQYVDLRDETFIYDKLKSVINKGNSASNSVSTSYDNGTIEYSIHYNDNIVKTYNSNYNNDSTSVSGVPSQPACTAPPEKVCNSGPGENDFSCTWDVTTDNSVTNNGFRAISDGFSTAWQGNFNSPSVDLRRTGNNSLVFVNYDGTPISQSPRDKDQFPLLFKSKGAIATNNANKSASPLHYLNIKENVLDKIIDPLSIEDIVVYFKNSIVVPPDKNLTIEADTKKVFYR